MRTVIIKVVAILILGGASLIGGMSVAWAERVPIRVERAGESRLMTFAWRDPVAYRHGIEDGRLTIGFSRPIDGPFDAVVQAMPDILEDPRPGADGRSLSFRLKVPAEVYAYYSGTAVTVELVVEDAAPAPPPLSPAATAPEAGDGEAVTEIAPAPVERRRRIAPAQAAPAAAPETPPADAPSIRVRTGEHADFTRVVFDFEAEVDYQVANADGVVTVRFATPARIEVDALNAGDTRLLGAARSRFANGVTEVTLAVPATASVRDFRSGPKIVLDVREPSGSSQPVALPAPAEAPSPADTGPVERTVEAATPPVEPTAATSPVEPAAATPPVEAAAAADQPATTAADPETETTLATSPPPAAATGRPVDLTAPVPAPAPDAAPTPDPAADDAVSPRAAGDLGPAVDARASAIPGDDRLAFRFDFDEPVAAAAFRRGGTVWIAFDKPMTVDTDALKQQAGEAAFEINQLPADGATVLNIRTSRRYNPAVSRDGLAWIVDLAERPLAPQTPLTVEAQPDAPVGARIFVSVPEPGRPVAVADPNIGDNFVIVPVIPLGQSIGQPFRYPQFDIPVAAQGVVVEPKIDDLRVRALRQGIEIGAQGVRFAISDVSADAAAHAQLAAARPMVLALEELAREWVPPETFRVARREREERVTIAPENRRTAERINLAKFLFANGYAPETLGVLRIALEDVPLLESDPGFRVMRGGASFLMGRYADAMADLTHESVVGNDEARLWAAATTAMMGDQIGAARDLRFTGSIARDYPRPLKMTLGILIAEVAAKTGDGQGARLFLDALNLEDPTPNELAMLKYAEGQLMELDGDFEAAVALWEEVIESDNRPARARARVALTEMLLQLRRIEHADAIEAYENLRFAWRGDTLEFNNLRRLGSLYLDEGYYRKGLATLKEAATHFRDLPEAPDVTKQMSDTFNALFLGNQADALEPVKAIAIYNEFKELTPAGPRGDEMIRNLADKLVEVDLLGRAAELLSAQVQFRLVGEQKARVGARLALIHILARKYERALEVLQGTESADLPEALVVERRHLRARALFGQDRDGEALALLADDESVNAELIRKEIFWTDGNWLEASSSLRRLVRESGARSGEPLTEVQAARILNYAIALTNSGGERAIAQLARDFGPAIAETKFAEAFQLVTTPSTVGVLDPSVVASKVEQAETFLTAYRDKLKDGVPLSSLN